MEVAEGASGQQVGRSMCRGGRRGARDHGDSQYCSDCYAYADEHANRERGSSDYGLKWQARDQASKGCK